MDIKALTKEIKNFSTKPERLLELARQYPHLARLIPKYRRSIPLDLFRELARSPKMPTRVAALKHADTPLEILELLAHDRQWTVVKAVFGTKVNRSVKPPDSLYETVAAHKRHTVRQTVAEHYLCPPHVLQRLARDPAPEVRRAVAENPKATPELLHRLAADPDDRVVWNVADHINTSNPTLDLLAEHPHPLTRQKSIYPYLSFSRKRAIPVERLVKLANDPERQILEDIIKHRQAPTWLVEQILNAHPELFQIEPQLYIRNGVVYGSLTGDPLAGAIENHPDLDYALLERTAALVDGSIVYRLLNHPKFDLNLLEHLTRAQLEYLAQLIAAPPAPSADTAEQKLFRDLRFHSTYDLTRLTLLENLPQRLQDQILKALAQVPLRDHAINQLLKSPFAAVRAFAEGRKPEW